MRNHRSIANIAALLETHKKHLYFVGSSLKDLRALPGEVRHVFGRALLDVQFGDTPKSGRAFGEGVHGIMKLIEDYDGQTFRAAYTTEFERAVYVLHVFQKKSKRGSATPQREIELIRERIKQARAEYTTHYEAEEG